MTTQTAINQRVLDILETFPEAERKQAIAAIERNGDWCERPDYEGVQVYYCDDGLWKTFELYVCWQVSDGKLQQGVWMAYPCGDTEWSEDDEDYIDADCEDFDASHTALWNRIWKENEESRVKYEKWVEENGKDPLDHYWLDSVWGDIPNLNDRFQVSLRAWAVNNKLQHQVPDWAKAQERFPEGFKSSFKLDRTIVEYPVKWHCGKPMTFSIDNDTFNDEMFSGWECLECGKQAHAQPDELHERKSGSEYEDSDY